MDERIVEALRRGRTVDITTVVRQTGKPRRIEIWLHHVDGHLYLSGMPGRRDWVANLRANPNFSLHLMGTVRADLSARASVITEEERRYEVLSRILSSPRGQRDLEAWVRGSPLVEVTVLGVE